MSTLKLVPASGPPVAMWVRMKCAPWNAASRKRRSPVRAYCVYQHVGRSKSQWW